MDILLIFTMLMISIGCLIYGGVGLKKGKIRAYGRKKYIYKDLAGKWGFIYSLILVLLGLGLLAGLVYNANRCGVTILC